MFQPGDVVCLIGSNTSMAVTKIDSTKERSVLCIWFDKDGEIQRDGFRPDRLELLRRES